MKKILICAALACCLTAAAHSNDNDIQSLLRSHVE